jgi:hypothetical protein
MTSRAAGLLGGFAVCAGLLGSGAAAQEPDSLRLPRVGIVGAGAQALDSIDIPPLRVLDVPLRDAGASPQDLRALRVSIRELPAIGSPEADERRVRQLLGGGTRESFVLQSLSSSLERPARGSAPAVELFLPRLDVAWNSDIPFSLNDGALRAERGWNTRMALGLRATAGPLSLVLAPEYVYEQNGEFEPLSARSEDAGTIPGRDSLAAPWYAFERGADLPLRFGYDQRGALVWGQSSASLDVGPISVGASTENRWWGPGIRNALVMSNHADGIPHAFLRTPVPIVTRVGSIEMIWMGGALRESEYFDSTSANDRRSLSAFALTFRPRRVPDLSLGIARSVYAALPRSASLLGHFADVFTRWEMQGEVAAEADDTREQILSLFGRWVFPADGVEVYGEWARTRLPSSARDFFEFPGFTQAYTLGFQGARSGLLGGTIRVQGELSELEQKARGRSAGSYYTSPHVAQGYTNRGQTIGAAIGPGASSQWAAADYLAASWRVGLFATRIRWDNDAYYAKPSGPRDYFGHDVSMITGVRGAVSLPLGRIDAELGSEKRYNYHYQNWGSDWFNSMDAVDVSNWTFRLTVSPSGLARTASSEPRN